MKRKPAKLLFLFLLTVTTLLSGCWDRRELEDLAFVQTIGIDKAPDNQLLVTFRIAIPSKAGLGAGGGAGGAAEGSVAAKSSLVTSIIAPTIPAAVTLASGYVNRELSLMHTKAVIFGEPFARKGVQPIASILTRYREFRRTVFLITCKGEAHDLLSQNAPDLEKTFAKYWEGVKMLQSKEAIHPGTLFQEFVTDLETVGEEPTMMYFAVNKNAKNPDVSKLKVPPSFTKGELGVKAGEIPRTGGNLVEYVGTSVFRADKFIDTLTLTETRAFLMMTGEFQSCLITVPDPLVKNRYIPLEVKLGSPPRINVHVDHNPVLIEEKISLEADITAVQSGKNYAGNEQRQVFLEHAIEKDLQARTLSVIKKLQKDKVDTVGFGDYARRKFLTMDEWNRFDWRKKFPEAVVKIDVKFAIRRTGMQGKEPGVWQPK